MDKKVLIIDFSKSFLVKGIVSALTELRYTVQTTDLNKEWVNNNRNNLPDIILFFADEDCFEEMNKIDLFKTICTENGKKIIPMGFAEDLEKIRVLFNKNILCEFERPINTKEIVDRICAIYNGNYDEEEKKKHILVVDDSGTMLNTIKGWLEDSYRISLVSSAFDAIAFLSKMVPDLILLDYEMPDCSGAQLLKMLRGHSTTKKTPVIFLTAISDRESITDVLDLKPEGYLLKTMPKEKIVSYIDNFFKNYKAL